MKINNIDDLRSVVVNALEELRDKKITIEEAGVTGKLCESVTSTLKLQVEVAKMLGREPNVPFLGETCSGRLIDLSHKNTIKKLIRS